MGCRDPNIPLRTLPSKPQDDEPPGRKKTPLNRACRVIKRQVLFDSSINDTPRENLSTDAYRIDEPENLSIDADDLVALKEAQDRGYDSDRMMAMNNEDC